MQVKAERPNDVERITHIQYTAFKGHPQHASGAEPLEHVIVERLRASGQLSLSLLAESGGDAVGHIAFSPAMVGEADSGWYLLGPVGVVPSHQGKGVGSALIREGLQQIQDKGAEGVVLVGDPELYKRFGFKAIHGLTYGGVPDQFVLGLSFTANVSKGEIVVHSAFDVSGT